MFVTFIYIKKRVLMKAVQQSQVTQWFWENGRVVLRRCDGTEGGGVELQHQVLTGSIISKKLNTIQQTKTKRVAVTV